MTLKFSESPAVQIKEIDLTGTVPAVTSTTGALVGDFNWGPVNKPILIGNESELASVFGNPNTGTVNVGDFLSASYFLKYSSSLYVVNVNPGAKSSDGVCQGKYPGSLGNKIDVSVCGPIDAADSDQLTNEFDNWTYASAFTSAPEGDEVHVVVLVDGVITETFEYLSTVDGALTTNGTTNYIVDVIANRSSWINFTSVPTFIDFDLGGGTFDITIANVKGKKVDVITSVGDKHLGGRRFDEEIINKDICVNSRERQFLINFLKAMERYFEIIKFNPFNMKNLMKSSIKY